MAVRKTKIERFISFIREDDSGCWVWTGKINKFGYGYFQIDRATSARAHRFAYEQWAGAIPDGLVIDHLCRNRACVNPDHLEPVTQAENTARGLLWQSQKTHCPAGHEYSLDNTRVRANGHRVCRTCHREQEAIRHEKRRAAA